MRRDFFTKLERVPRRAIKNRHCIYYDGGSAKTSTCPWPFVCGRIGLLPSKKKSRGTDHRVGAAEKKANLFYIFINKKGEQLLSPEIGLILKSTYI